MTDLPAPPPVLLLPACSYPSDTADDTRETDLNGNLRFLMRARPGARIVLCDNGRRAPRVPPQVTLMHDPGAFSSDASIGECRNLLNGLRDLADDTRVLKLHARCKLRNFADLDRFLANAPEFFLASPNLWGKASGGYDELPYIDTRVFVARAELLRRVLSQTLDLLETSGGRMEQALLAVLMRRPTDCALVHKRGSFFPILEGTSGHGRNYGSVASRLRARVKASIFRLGL